MRERGYGSRFPLKSFEEIGRGRQAWRQDLDGDEAFEPAVTGPVHLAHAAGAEHADNFIGAEPGPRRNGHNATSVLRRIISLRLDPAAGPFHRHRASPIGTRTSSASIAATGPKSNAISPSRSPNCRALIDTWLRIYNRERIFKRMGRSTPRHVHLSTRLLRAAEGELDGPLVPAPSTVVGRVQPIDPVVGVRHHIVLADDDAW